MSKPDPTSPDGPRRFYELDSLRGIAALTVVFFHFAHLCSARTQHLLLHSPLRILVAGHQAVVLFFLLSGFVLTLPYQKRRRLNYAPFLLKRVCRIYLPYLGALALAVLCDLTFPARRGFDNYWINFTWTAPVTSRLVLQHILFLGNYDWAQFNTAFWSLVYEMRISLIFPFLALTVLRLRSAWILLAAAVLSLAYQPLALLLSQTLRLCTYEAALNTTLTLHYAAFFLVGSLMATHLATIHRRYRRFTAAQSTLLALVAFVLYSFGNASSFIARLPFPPGLYDWPVACGAAVILIMAMNNLPFHRFLTSRAIHHLGKVSYSLYLIHGTVLFALVHTLYQRVSMPTLLVLYLAITLAVTEVFHLLIERPAMLLGRRLTAAPRAPQRTAVPS